jgi:hypothetical protein
MMPSQSSQMHHRVRVRRCITESEFADASIRIRCLTMLETLAEHTECKGRMQSDGAIQFLRSTASSSASVKQDVVAATRILVKLGVTVNSVQNGTMFKMSCVLQIMCVCVLWTVESLKSGFHFFRRFFTHAFSAEKTDLVNYAGVGILNTGPTRRASMRKLKCHVSPTSLSESTTCLTKPVPSTTVATAAFRQLRKTR